MGGFRARDADRERYVDVIEAAYVDGQLGDADRELRVARALSAETLDELESLTRDLQAPAGSVPAVERSTPAPVQRSSPVVALLVAAFAVFVVLGAIGALALLATGDGSDTATSQDVTLAPDPVASAEATPATEPASFRMTADQVRAFLRAYEREFGTLDAWDVAFYPERVSVDVPVRGSRPRYETWAWDGAWERTSEARATSPFHTRVVDLGRIGADRLMDNIRTAERTLRVQRGTFTHAVLWDDDTVGPTLNIHVGNEFGENGYLRTTLRGDRIVFRLPYDA